MELSDYIRILRRGWRLILTLAATGGLLGWLASFAIGPTYIAETKLFVAIQNSGTVQELQQGNTFSQARVQSYVETVDTPLVLQPVVDSLGLEQTPAELAELVTSTADLDSVIISISAKHESPVQAAAIARATAESLVQTVASLESPADGGASPVKLSVLAPAVAPTQPSSPNTQLNLLLGLLVGSGLGFGLAVLRSAIDTRVIGESDLRRVSDIPLLGGISFDSDATKKPLLTQVPGQSPRAESFRQIRTNLQFAHVGHHSKAMLVTSSLPGEGKSTTATNLSIALAQSGQSVALVDADLRRPRVHEYLGLERNAGLTTVLVGRADVEEVLQPWGEDELYVLTSGQLPPNPSELLGSDAMKQLITRLEKNFDAVIIDAPPLLPVTDAAVLAQRVGGVVMVVGSSKVKSQDLQKSLSALGMVEADVLGVVLNLLPTKGHDAYAYAYYASDEISESKVTRPSRRKSQPVAHSEFDDRNLRPVYPSARDQQ